MNLFAKLTVLLVFLPTSFCFAEMQMIYIASPARPPVIYRCTLDTTTGAFGKLDIAALDVNTGFMARHPSLPILYAATSETAGRNQPNGAVRAYKISGKDGALTLLNQATTNDNGTTHIEVARNGGFVVVCHYGGAGTSAIPLHEDGTLQETVSQVRHEGSSVDPQRQTRPHPHGIAVSHDCRFACVADLGNDRVEVFRLREGAKLEKSSSSKAEPGAGPRHVTFHPNGKWLYCINELNSTIDLLAFDSASGKLSKLQTISTLPKDFTGDNSTAEVVVHPNGKFLYGSNRGHDSTAVFAIDEKSGRLTLVEHEPTQGNHPRFVGLDPTGSIYIAANMNSDNLVSFKIDPDTGSLEPTGHKLAVARPMCVVFKR